MAEIQRDKNGRAFINCGCNSEMISVWWDDEWEFDIVELSWWKNYSTGGFWQGIRQRLFHIRDILLHGHPYCDFMCMEVEEAEKFVEVMKEYIGKAKAVKQRREEDGAK